MPAKKKLQKQKQDIQIKTLVSEEDLERHGGRKQLSKKFRDLRDGKTQ